MTMMPGLADPEDVLAQLALWHAEGRSVALATVIDTWGSSPRPRGSRMAITAEGGMAGSVSAGCVEGAVVEAAADVLASGQPVCLSFGVSNDRAWEVGLTCGGRMRVYLEKFGGAGGLGPEMLARLQAAAAQRLPVVLATRLRDGAQFLLPEDASAVPQALAQGCGARLGSSNSGCEIWEAEEYFCHVHAPAPRLVIVGAVHIAQSLVPLAGLAGFEPIVIDPRARFANAARFGALNMLCEWPDAALGRLGLDASTAIVTLSHDPKIDDVALDLALRSQAFYIGALGSRASHAARLKRMAALGHEAAALARIRGPVGLAIGAQSTGEIALSIMAELVAVRRQAALGTR